VRAATDTVGRILAALGAIWLLASLFMPWYRPAVSGSLRSGSSYYLIFWSGKGSGDGWQTLSVIDIYLAVVAAATLIACVLSVRELPRRRFGAIGVAALIALGLIIYRWIDPAVHVHDEALKRLGPPGVGPSISIQPRIGIFIALASALAILVGSAVAYFRSWSFKNRLALSRGPRSAPTPDRAA
jgi:hypothetical protein